MTKTKPRECQPCSACCDGWVQMNIGGVDVYPGNPCPHSSGKGCDDYENRPLDPCVNFKCGWVIPNSPLPDWMKPNEAKTVVIFDKLRWNNYSVDLAVPVGKRIPPRSLQWLKQFSQQHTRLLIYAEQITQANRFSKQQNITGFGPPDFQQDLLQWKQQGKKLW